MTKKINQWFKKLVALTLVVTMSLPHMALAAEPMLSAEELAWRNLPEITAYGFDMSAFPDAAAEAEQRLQSLLQRMGSFDSFTAEEKAIVLAHLGHYNNELAESELVEAIRAYSRLEAHDAELYFDDAFYTQEVLQIDSILNRGLGYSALAEDDRVLIFRYLSIAYDAQEITNELFRIMERDGFSLSESVELVRIMATGLFDYIEAQTMLASFPNDDVRIRELERFEQFARMFDIEDEVNGRRLLSTPFVSMNNFSEIDEDEDWMHTRSDVSSLRDDFYSSMQADDFLVLEAGTGRRFIDISNLLNANRSNEVYTFFEAAFYDYDNEITLPDEVPQRPGLDEPPLPPGTELDKDDEDYSESEDDAYGTEDEEYEADSEYDEYDLESEEGKPETDSSAQPQESQQERTSRAQPLRFMSYGAQSNSTLGTIFDERDFWTFDLENELDEVDEYPETEDPHQDEDEECCPECDDSYYECEEDEDEDEYEYPEYGLRYPELGTQRPPLNEQPQAPRPQPQRRRHRIRNPRFDSAMQTRAWRGLSETPTEDWRLDEVEFTDPEGTREIFEAFTNADAFNVARQMFLDSHRASEINTAFSLGAALQQEPWVFIIQSDIDTYEPECHDKDERDPETSADIDNPEYEQDDDTASDDEEILDDLVDDDEQLVLDTPDEPTTEMYLSGVELVQYVTGVNDDELLAMMAYGAAIMLFNATQLRPPSPLRSTTVSNPFELSLNAEESVCLNTGAAIFRTNVLSLPGRNGFGLNLDLVYNSSNADMVYLSGQLIWDFETQECCCGETQVTWGWVPANETAPRPSTFQGLGIGWTLELPHIQHNVLYLPGRGSFALNYNNTAFRDHTLQDMQFYRVSAMGTFNYRLVFHNGTSYQFNGSGHISNMRDRFGNAIRFEYANISAFDNMRLLTRIVDTNGKIIRFDYHAPDNNNRTITVTAPDNSTNIIRMARVESGWFHPSLIPFSVQSIQNQVGVSTYFNYSAYYFNWFTLRPHNVARLIPILTLDRVIYPSGAELHFTYQQFYQRLDEYGGWRQSQRVVSRHLSSQGRNYLVTEFEYLRESTGFVETWQPVLGIHPPPAHTYGVTVIQNNGLRTSYTFDYRSLLTRTRTYNYTTLLSEEVIEYGNRSNIHSPMRYLPTATMLTERRGENTRTNHQTFTYNRFGQLIQSVSPLAQGSTSARYRTTQTYDDRFGLPLVTTFSTGPVPCNILGIRDTFIRHENILSADGRSIIRAYIYENGVRQSRTNFIHDIYGNVIEIREFPNAAVNTFISTHITFDRGTLPQSIRTSGIRDAAGGVAAGGGVVERRFVYDNMWRLVSEIDPNGYTTSYQYDRLGRVTQITFPNGGIVTYAYNDQQNTMTHRTVLGATYIYQYDPLGNLLTITANDVLILTNIYDTRMRITETRNAQGVDSSQRTEFEYDIFDRVIETRSLNPAGAILHLITTAYQDISDIHGNSLVTTTVHGDANAPSITTFAQNDQFGRRIQEGVAGGKIIMYTHDLAGRVTREQSYGVDNHFTYNIHGVTSITNIEGYTAYNTYDHMGRLLTSSDFMGNAQRFTYDVLGRLIQHDIPFERVGNTVHYTATRYFYDRNSNLIRTSSLINLPGQAQRWASTYNAFRHNRLVMSRTGGNNTSSPTDTDSARTDYTYDLAGNILTKRVGNLGNIGIDRTREAITIFTYNNRGQLISSSDALMQIETFTYDSNGLLLTRGDREGTLFFYTYDHMGRLVREDAWRDLAPLGHRAYTFTAAGALRTETNGTHTITYYYDAQGRVIRQEESDGTSNWFVYNAANNIIRSLTGIGDTAHVDNHYTFDAVQRVIRVDSLDGEYVKYAFDADGNRISQTLSNGVVTEYILNAAGLVTSMVNRHGNTTLSRFDYLYYLDGNTHRVVEQVTVNNATIMAELPYTTTVALSCGTATALLLFDTIDARYQQTFETAEILSLDSSMEAIAARSGTISTITTTYSYDLARRLSREVRVTDGSVTTTVYAFDNRNNRTRKTVTGDESHVTTYIYDLNNRLTSKTRTEAGVARTTTFTYDRNGNQLTQRVTGEQQQTFTYDVFNRLTNVSRPAGFGLPVLNAVYTYRADGLRHGKTVNGVTITHVWSMGSVVMERNATGGVINRFHRGVGHLISSDQHGFYLFNVRGDVVQRVDGNGIVIHTYRYDAFGNELNEEQANTNPFRFAGEYLDFETGFIYLRARFYNPVIGRFISEDPFWNIHNMQASVGAKLQAANLFAFVANNPVKFIDPSGLSRTVAMQNQQAYNEARARERAAARGMISLQCAAEELGGSFTWNSLTSTATITIGSMELNFTVDGNNVALIYDIVFVQAEFFGNTFMGGADEVIFLGGHSALGGLPVPHMNITMFISRNSAHWNHTDFQEFPALWGGTVRRAHISGGAQNETFVAVLGLTTAISVVNRDDYFNRSGVMFTNHLYSGSGMVTQLFDAHNHFMDNYSNRFVYRLVPGRGTVGTTPIPRAQRYNSTSVTLSLLSAVGLDHGLSTWQQVQYLGSFNRIPSRFFGR